MIRANIVEKKSHESLISHMSSGESNLSVSRSRSSRSRQGASNSRPIRQNFLPEKIQESFRRGSFGQNASSYGKIESDNGQNGSETFFPKFSPGILPIARDTSNHGQKGFGSSLQSTVERPFSF